MKKNVTLYQKQDFYEKIINKLLPLFIFIILTVIFYGNLFLPRLSVYFTPDLGRSDIINIFSFRYLLTQLIKLQEIPLWTNQVGTGIPLLVSGQFSIFNIIDYILLSFFPPALSTNLLYLLFTLIALLSTYGFVRYLKLSRSASIFVAIVFSFSGAFIFRIQHQTVFTASCLLPLVFLLALRAIDKLNIRDALILAFVISQQIFISHPQYVLLHC